MDRTRQLGTVAVRELGGDERGWPWEERRGESERRE
jgi:hypothetical protein